MYVPPQFREERPEVLVAAMRRIRLMMLVTAADGSYHATHVPAVVAMEAGRIVVTSHLARANPHWRAAAAGAPSLAVFQGPHAYVSPSYYPSKAAHGKVVPTWNYIVVHVHGTLEAVDDTAFIRAQVAALTNEIEAGRGAPWRVEDAPAGYIDGLVRAIVGVRLAAERVEGSWKLIQHKPEADRLGTIAGLRRDGSDDAKAIADAMAGAEGARRRA
jgi:transcriptional regulator